MKTFRFLRAAALALPLLGCAPRPAVPMAVAHNARFRHVAIGLCEDYPRDSRTLAAARNDLHLLQTNHIGVLRIAFSWLDMEPAPEKFDWSFWDQFVRMAVDDYGIRLIPYICYTPRWAASGTNGDYWQQPPRNDTDFSNFVSRIVCRYKGRIHSWEIWNEPDNPYYWRGSVEQYEHLLQTGARAVRRADPRANVVMGGLAWNLDFLKAVLTNAAALRDVDVINLHNYYETWASQPLDEIPAYVGRAGDLIRQYGRPQRLWMAEVGYSSFRRGPFVSGQYLARFRREHTPAAQAAALFRVISLLLASGKVSLVAWYRIHDLPAAQDVIGDENNRHLGILDGRGQAKPALRALQFIESLFKAGYCCIDAQVRVSKKIAEPLEAHVFQLPDGRVVATAWLRTYIPGARGNDFSGRTPDQRQATIDLRFPFPLKDPVERRDALGNRLGTLAEIPSGNGSKILHVRVRDGAVTVLIGRLQ